MQLTRSDRVPRAGENPLRWIMIALPFCNAHQLPRSASSVCRGSHSERSVSHEQYCLFQGDICVHGRLHDHERSIRAFVRPSWYESGLRNQPCLVVSGFDVARIVHWPMEPWIYRFLLGMGEAGNWPAAVKVVAEWFPARERPLASGMFNSGSAVGAIVAPPLFAWIILRYGWQDAFAFVGLIGLIFVAIWGGLLYASEVPGGGATSGSDRIHTGQSLRPELHACQGIHGSVWYFYIFWFPEYLARARKLDMAHIGRYAWIPFLIAGSAIFWADGYLRC